MRAKMYLKNFGEFYRNQVEFASAVILSRSQNVKEDIINLLQHNMNFYEEKN